MPLRIFILFFCILSKHIGLSQPVFEEPVCDMFYMYYTSKIVKPFADKHKLKRDYGSYYINKAGSVAVATNEDNSVIRIEFDCSKEYKHELPFKLYKGMDENAVMLRLGYPGVWDERRQYLSYFYDRGIEVQVWMNNPVTGITNSLVKIIILTNNKYNDDTRLIKYGGALHPSVHEKRKAAAQIKAADTSSAARYIGFINYASYPNEYRYYNKNAGVEVTMKNNIAYGVMYAEGKLHMRGVFKIYDRQYIPDKRFFTTLYDYKDTTIKLTARFDGFYNIDTCVARLKYRGRDYLFRIYSPMGVLVRTGIDTIDNQYLLNYFKWKTELPGSDTTKLFIADGNQYYIWYTSIYRKEKTASNPVITQSQNEYNRFKKILDAAADAFLKAQDNNYYLLETKDAGMDGAASTCNKTFTLNLTSRDKYVIYYLVPEKYLLNMRLKGYWTYQLAGERKSIETGIAAGISLGSGVVGFKQELSPQNSVPGACCYQLESSLIRLANDATFPVKMIIKKNRF